MHSASIACYRRQAETFVGRLDGKLQVTATESLVKQALCEAGDDRVGVTGPQNVKSVFDFPEHDCCTPAMCPSGHHVAGVRR
jgi:hypothetical protein